MNERWKRVAQVSTACAIALTAAASAPGGAHATDCGSLLGLFQAGRSTVEIARMTGLSSTQVQDCRRELSQPVFVGPEGAPPLGAAGPPPRNAVGPPPLGAAGPPPLGAAGPAPRGREVKRLP
jgi:hypothetical protein